MGPPPSPPSRVDILLVDDRPANLLALESILVHPDYNLVLANSGEQALAEVLRRDFAVILLDVAMPGLDGIEIASLIKRRPASAGTPILFVTASIHDMESITRAYKAGGVDYLQKPLEPFLVRAKVAVFAQLYRQRQQIQRQAELLREGERREHEHQLIRERLASEERLATMLRSIGEGVIAVDDGGAVTFMNPVAERLTGWPLGEAAGRPLGEVFALTAEETGQPLAMEWSRSGRLEGVSRIPAAHLRARDGRQLPIEDSCAPIRDPGGQPAGVVVVFRDVFEQRQEEARRRLLAEASTALLGSLEYDQTLRSVTRFLVPVLADAGMVILPEEGGQGARVAEVACEDPALRARLLALMGAPLELAPEEPVAAALEGGGPRLVEPAERAAGDDGGAPGFSRRLARLGLGTQLAVPLSARGRTLGALLLCRRNGSLPPPGELAAAEELGRRFATALDSAQLYREAQAAIQLRDDFLSVAAHELRTPLTALSLQAQALRGIVGGEEDSALAGRLSGKLGLLVRQTERLNRLIGSLLDVAVIRGRRLELHRERVELAELVEELAERFEDAARRAGCELRVEVCARPTGTWDRLRLEQVLANLLSNALKYAAGAPVTLRVAARDGVALAAVSDRGIGISPEVVDRIFDRFVRGVTSRNYGGLGLGLYIARQIVEAHGGELRVSSRPGAGASFTVVLPAEPAAAGAHGRRATEHPSGPASENKGDSVGVAHSGQPVPH